MQADALLPRPPEGMARGAGLALLVHAGLVVALTLGVGWRMQAPEVVSAELWSSIPQVAAPKIDETPTPTPAPPPPPPPAPVRREATPQVNEAQIATERAERKKREEQQEREKAELQKKREAEDKKKRDQEALKVDQAKLDKLREEQMKRMLGTLQGSGAPNATGSASRDTGPSQAYRDKLISAIRAQIRANDIPGNPEAEVEVRATPTGTILVNRLTKPSGVKEWDEAVLRGIDRLGTLPSNPDGPIPQEIKIRFRPKE